MPPSPERYPLGQCYGLEVEPHGCAVVERWTHVVLFQMWPAEFVECWRDDEHFRQWLIGRYGELLVGALRANAVRWAQLNPVGS